MICPSDKKFGGGTTPSGTIQITENGTVDVTQYAQANVQVSNVRTLTAEVTAYASYSSLAGFINAYWSFLLQRQSNEIIYCKFINNTTNTRAGIDCYILFNGDGVSRRVGTSGTQAAGNGLDVYAGCTIEFNYIAMLGE